MRITDGIKGIKKAGLFLPAAVLVFLGTAIAEPGDSLSRGADENEKTRAIEESILKAQGSAPTGATMTKKPLPPAPTRKAPPAGAPEETVQGKETPPTEETDFFVSEDIIWTPRPDGATVVIVTEEKEMPPAAIETAQEGRVVRWVPAKTLVVKKKKNNPVESPFLQGVVFRENPEKTKKLGLEAPYYAADELLIVFAAPVFYDAMQEEGRLTIEFTPVEKKKPTPPDIEAMLKKTMEAAVATTSPSDILGSFFQVKEQYEAFVMGGFRPDFLERKTRAESRPSQQLFDGTYGFPADVKPVYDQEYPKIGTAEYFKKHVRAAVKNTFGFSSDFDGLPTAWSGTSTRNRAGFWTPDIEVAYDGFGYEKPAYGRKTPDAALNVSYRAQRLLPVSHLLHFNDGLRYQTINFGGNYLPQKRYALFSQNTIVLFGGKTVDRGASGFFRDYRKGYRMTNAVGFNYRLTEKLLWRNGTGYEMTRSQAPAGRSRDQSGFLTTSLEQRFTKRATGELGYSYRHIFKDTGPSPSPSVRITKGKDLQHISGVFRYKLSRDGLAEGGAMLDVIDGNIFKFGVRGKLRYKIGVKNLLQADYFNGAIQEDTNKLVGVRGNRGRDTGITLSRYERVGVSWRHAIDGFVKAARPSTLFALAFDYRRNLPMAGVYYNQSTNDSGFNFQASILRKLRGGLMWLELTYQYSTFKSRDPNMNRLNSTDASAKEHAVMLILTNYLGRWEEIT